MSLWAKVQQLPQNSPCLNQIKSIYGDNFPIEVRHYLAHSIEEKFWTNIDQNNVDNDQYQMYVFNVVHQFIQEIEQKSEAATAPDNTEFLLKLKLAETAKMFKDRYSAHPTQLFTYVRHCLAMEMKYLQEAGVDIMGGGPMLSVSHMASEILRNLDIIRRKTQETNEITTRLAQEQESFALQYHEGTKLNAQLQTLGQGQDQFNPNPQLQTTIQSLIRKKDVLELELQRKIAQLIELRIQLVEKLKATYDMIAKVQGQILDEELIRWKRDQQLAGNGVPFTSYLDTIQDWCESLAELIWFNRQQLKEVERQKQKLPLDTPGVNDLLAQLSADITQLLSTLVTTTFIIEKQPPQVMKTNTRFTATVRLLVGGKLNVHMSPPQVKVTIISEHQANMLLKNDNNRGKDTSGEILNNTGTMEYQQNTRQLSVSFRNMQLKKIKRAEKKGTESVMDEKFSLFFQSQFSIGGGELMFQVWTLSLPVVVIVHGNQEPHAWATVTWDNAFSEPERCPFVVPEKVPWIKVKETLSQKFKHATGRGLTEENLRFLADKAFRGTYNESTNCMLSWAQFCKEPLSDRNFTFWEWFFAIMKLTREHLRGPWAEGAIMGFLTKKKAEDLLSPCIPGTFLLRFSDSELGGITIAWVSESQEVFSLMPMTSKDFQIRSLADRILDLNHLTNLYPELSKEAMFRKYYTPPTEPHQSSRTGYVISQLVTHVPGLPGAGGGYTPQTTPQHNWAADPSRDTPSVGSSYNPGSVATAMAATPYNPYAYDLDETISEINFSELMDNPNINMNMN